MKKYFTGLDILRFFAAFGVVNFHYFFGLTDKLSWYRYGNLGVQLFFFISGFVISQSVARSTTKEFIAGRFIRLFPLFWITCTFTYIFTLVMPGGLPVRFPEYLISMTMLGDKLSQALGYGGLVDPSYWTLSVELLFYIMIGAFVYFFTWKRIRYFFWGWLIVSGASFLFQIDQNFFMKLLLVRHASYFITGGALALCFEEGRSHLQKYSDYILVTIAITYSTMISYIALPPYFRPNPLDNNIIALAHPVLFILILIAIYLSRYLRSSRAKMICGVIGGLTYPLYLIHQTVGNTLIRYFSELHSYPRTTVALLTEIGMLGIAYITYRYDKKLRNYLRSRFLPKSIH